MFSLCVWRRKINLVCWHRAWLRSPLLAASVFEVFGEEAGQLTASLRLVSSVQRLLSAYTHTGREGETCTRIRSLQRSGDRCPRFDLRAYRPCRGCLTASLSPLVSLAGSLCNTLQTAQTGTQDAGYRDSCSLLRHSN